MNLRKFKIEDLSFLNYKLDEIQDQFTRTADWCINERKDLQDPLKTPVTILYDGMPVGFFVLDFGEDKCDYTENKNAILLRSLSLNPNYQGKGNAKNAMIEVENFVKLNIESADEIVFSVYFKNTNAYQLYLKTGFIDDGKTVIGRNGPLHILSKKI